MPITVTDLSYTYMKKTPYEKKALQKITLEIKDGEVFGIIGSTGSGKSTFVQHLNGLIKIQEGKIEAFDINLADKKADFKTLRSKIGMVFQYPEYQLFEETVLKDVSFGPKNMGLKEQEITERAKKAINLVGLNFEEVNNRSPFELSGGQKRRVAIAGIIAMEPEVLILDEPTAGLDPKGKKEILELIMSLKKNVIKTVVIISHDMDEISNYADRIAVFHDSKLLYVKKTEEIFKNSIELTSIGLDVPVVIKLKEKLAENNIRIPENIIKMQDFIDYITMLYQSKRARRE
jgi:energy-coupling factor transport system ATP-binding protein